MIELYVCVRLHGTVVDQRVVPVVDGMRLGEATDATVSFPGADLVVRTREGAVFVRGRRLDDDDMFSMSLGAVHVTLEVVRRDDWQPNDLDRVWRRLENAMGAPIQAPDWRLLVATAAIALVGSSWDAMSGFVSTNPVAAQNVHALMEQLDLAGDATRSAYIRAPEQIQDRTGTAGAPQGAPPADALPEVGTARAHHEDWPPPVRVRVE